MKTISTLLLAIATLSAQAETLQCKAIDSHKSAETLAVRLATAKWQPVTKDLETTTVDGKNYVRSIRQKPEQTTFLVTAKGSEQL
jgi:hypothetical protein